MPEVVKQSEIPIENIYYLLSYAWDYLPETEEVKVLAEDCHSVEELLARILTNGTQHLLRRGTDRDYVPHREETSRLKGRFDLTTSFSSQTMHQGRLVCEFDELSHNVLHNQILKTTLKTVLKNRNLQKKTRSHIQHQLKMMQEVREVRITKRLFRRIPLHRNNQHYRLLMHVCELIFHSFLPTEKEGEYRLRDFLRDQRQMPILFEKFILNFYKRNSDFRVSSPYLYWNLDGEGESQSLVPRMETDVCLIKPDRQIILDCKFYKEAFSYRKKAQKFKSTHLYQLFSYLENSPRKEQWHNQEGMLLYPATSQGFSHELKLNGHKLRLLSIDLDQPWRQLHQKLLALLD